MVKITRWEKCKQARLGKWLVRLRQKQEDENKLLRRENEAIRNLILELGGAVMVMLAACTYGQSIQRNIAWDYDTNRLKGITFRVHSSTNAAIPIVQWPPSFTLTNMVTPTTNAPITIRLPQEFFVVSASNVVGITFSEVLEASLPASGTNLRFF